MFNPAVNRVTSGLWRVKNLDHTHARAVMLADILANTIQQTTSKHRDNQIMLFNIPVHKSTATEPLWHDRYLNTCAWRSRLRKSHIRYSQVPLCLPFMFSLIYSLKRLILISFCSLCRMVMSLSEYNSGTIQKSQSGFNTRIELKNVTASDNTGTFVSWNTPR